jgi:hypothetical protein
MRTLTSALAALLALAAPAVAQDATPAATPAAPPAAAPASVPTDLRGTRYCEVIPVYRDGLSFRLEVYNTLGRNDCPPAVWTAIDPKKLAKELGADEVVMNGPRFWVMDRIIPAGATKDGATRSFDGLEATQRATLTLPFRDIVFGSRPYSVKTINRETTYVYDAGKPVYEITDDTGQVYVMQTFAEIVDKTLSMDDLAALGSRLTLPGGWRYTTRVLDAEMRLTASGEAFLIQDELQNSYQRRN